jgi:hypothetical protein
MKTFKEYVELEEAYKKTEVLLGDGYVIDKLGYDSNGNWTYIISSRKKAKIKVQHQGDWSRKVTKDDKGENISKEKIATEIKEYITDVLNESDYYISEAKPKKFIGTLEKFSYAVQLNDFDATTLKGGNFGTQVKLNTVLKKWKKGAKSDYVPAKGKPTLSAVKEWIKENNPTEFYAKWQSDSSSYKDDTFEIFYK